MRILYNGRFRQKTATGGGTHYYATRLHEALQRHPGADVIEVEPGGLISAANSSLRTVRDLGGVRGHLEEQMLTGRVASAIDPNAVLLSPANWGPWRHRRHVVVVHDIGPLVQPQHFSRNYVRLASLLLPRLVERAQGIIAVSEHTRDEIVQVLNRTGPIAVVRPAAVLGTSAAAVTPVPPAEPTPYLLFVGGHDRRKNLAFLRDVWGSGPTGLSCRLVVTRLGLEGPLRGERLEHPLWSYVDDPDDSRLGVLYANASGVLQPSLYEGFGLPILEAMSTGVPFVSSRTGAAVEVAEAARAVGIQAQVLPLSTAVWRAAIRRLGGDRPGRVADVPARVWNDVATEVMDFLATLEK